ncbi:unnamed protein product [Rotaria sp. Silwood1]|nr:unnamed protein product [Rotaria sp. Silwood1]CAF4520600.1 unnamed protein product [Rotaria sp. Silwood1]
MDQMDEDFEFRVVLLKIQNSLSDTDRKQLHFLFSKDIPRRLQDGGSLEDALDALQTLFDRAKISRYNNTYLIRGLQAIERHDCVDRLLSYQKLVPAEIIPTLPEEEQRNQATMIRGLPPINISERPTNQEILDSLAEDDIMRLPPETDKVSIKFNAREPDPMDFNSINLEPFEDSSHPWTEEYSKLLNLKFHPRNYQIEIIRNAIRNGNTIVCLRTGSGKTFIASILIKYYFIKHQKTNSDKKFSCLFFVPRKAIRLQQANAILDVNNLRVQICEDDQTIDQLIGVNHVIVATPQKFVNCLNKETIRLSQIHLMIFDECHNTSGGNPYCEIMKYYSCPSKQQNTTEKPLIIGLTATISAKDTNEKQESIEKNLISLCSKLACKNISTVCDKDNIDEINREICRPTNDQFQYVSKVYYNSYFDEYLKLFQDLIKNIKLHLDGKELLDGQEIGSSGFIGQIVLLKQTFERKGDMNNIIMCDYLSLLTKKYLALKNLPFDMVIQYILQKIEEYHKGHQQSIPMNNLFYERCKMELDKILNKCMEHPTTNSKLDTLVHLLEQHATENTKGLILVQTTFYAKSLCDYLRHHPKLKDIIKTTWIVGQTSSDHALTIHEQEARLRQFQGDECNVLIATDIVQEGLDIPTCSYVIRYEFVSDEIGTIQSRGRARAQNSSYYLITECDSMNHKREKKNKFREEEMEEAIDRWRTLDKDLFQRAVEIKTNSLINDWENALRVEMQQKAMLQKIGKKNGSICCRKCNRELGELAWLKKRNTIYFINNPEFFNNNECKLDSIYENFQENLIMGEVKCTCGNSLGGCQKFIDRPELGTLCALKCKQIKFKIDKQPPYIEFQQWSKNNRFEVEELEEI